MKNKIDKTKNIRKIFSILIIIILTGLAPINSGLAASAENADTEQETLLPHPYEKTGDGLDTEFILEVASELSDLIDYNGHGREYGSPGERSASEILKTKWEEEISSNVYRDRIDKGTYGDPIDYKTEIDEYELDVFGETIPSTECFPIAPPAYGINPSIYDFQNAKVYLIPDNIYKTANNAIKKTPLITLITNICKNIKKISKILNLNWAFKEDQSDSLLQRILPLEDSGAIYLLEMKKMRELGLKQSDVKNVLRNLISESSDSNPNLPKPSAFICSDYNDDTHFMEAGSWVNSGIISGFEIPGVMVNGSLGQQIREKINSEETVNADFYIKSHEIPDAESYNVIGTIPGKKSDAIVIGAHYDSWWGHCVIDNAVGVGIIWGIAKYYANYYANIGELPPYTLKFVAFGGEECFYRGSQFYAWESQKNNEKIKFMINVDTVCYKNSIEYPKKDLCLNIWQSSDKTAITSKIQEIVDNSSYEQISGGYGIKVKGNDHTGIALSDSASFTHITGITDVIAFDKGEPDLAWHFYHRDGKNHEKGDTWELLDEDDVIATSNVILQTAGLTLNYDTVTTPVVTSPTTTTQSASNVNYNSATLNGNLIDTGGLSCQVWFQWGTSTAYGQKTSLVSKDSTGTFYRNIANLQANTVYHYRSVAQNTIGTSYGNDVTFKTTNCPPIVYLHLYGPLGAHLAYSTSTDTIEYIGTINTQYTFSAYKHFFFNPGENTYDPPIGSIQGYGWEFPGSCFLAGTKVTMTNGTHKNIEDLKIGDLVKTYNEDNNLITSSKIVNTFHHEPDEMPGCYLIVNSLLRVTPNHMIYVNNNWEKAEQIKIGDTLRSIAEKTITVRSIEVIYEHVPTYNLEIENYHTYYAEDILVHNAGTGKTWAWVTGSTISDKTKSWSTPGTYYVILHVRDNNGAVSEAKLKMTITNGGSSSNQQPGVVLE